MNNSRYTAMKNTNTLILPICILGCMFILSGCANNGLADGCLTGHTFGFFGGLWHGLIAPIDLVIMLFRHDITVYAPNNNGVWYAFGFVLGGGGWGFLGGHGASRRRRSGN
jgi:hypothetical protein